jgi:biopolymer transport protein ExbD
VGAANRGGDDEDMISGINVTPLVDIVLVLLIIFMVTAKLIVNPALPIELPKAASGEPPPQGPLTIVIGKDGALLVDGATVDEAALPALVKARKATAPGGDVNALISADLATQHGRVVKVMDLLRREGISRFGISVSEDELAGPAPAK